MVDTAEWGREAQSNDPLDNSAMPPMVCLKGTLLLTSLARPQSLRQWNSHCGMQPAELCPKGSSQCWESLNYKLLCNQPVTARAGATANGAALERECLSGLLGPVPVESGAAVAANVAKRRLLKRLTEGASKGSSGEQDSLPCEATREPAAPDTQGHAGWSQ